MVSSPFPSLSTQLDYPLYAVDFDPEDANRLVVAGGGGAGRSGVGNKITVLDIGQQELRVAGEIDLSRDEDSVMSLAMGPSKGKTRYIYAGVNSSPDDMAKGKNEHLRTIALEQLKARSAAGSKVPDVKVSEASRTAAFTDGGKDTYQRLLRVAGSVGVAATALGKEHQLAVFEASAPKPKIKGVLELAKEAEGLDIVDKGDGNFQVAFCYKYELHLANFGKEQSDPELVFTVPDTAGERPVFRSLRYLNPHFLIAVANLPNKSGVVIQGFRLPTPGHENARLAVNAIIPRKIMATALAVVNLAPPASAGDPIGDTQFVIAVGGHDSSLSLFTLEHKSMSTINILANLHPLYTLKDVHGGVNISGLAFSPFTTPKTHIRPQAIKVASISLQKTVAVHTIPLKKFIDKTPRNKKAPPKAIRYIVEMKSTGPSPRPLLITLAVMVLIAAIGGQVVVEMAFGGKPVLHAHKWLPSWHGTLRTPDFQPPIFFEEQFVAKLTGSKEPLAEGETLVLREATDPVEAATGAEGETQGDVVNNIQVDVHDEEVHGPGLTWEELPVEQQDAWKDKLYHAGAWTQGMGESVFRGILFGELAGAVGRAVAGG